MQSISTNTDAINASRHYSINQAKLSKANAQLASGRIDSDPSENPAASAVGAVLETSIQGFTQASSNATQASALIQLATGALSSEIEVLQRMKTLSSQANSNAIGDSERSMLNKEFQALVDQIDDTASIEWNGISLFTGGGGTLTSNSAASASGTLTTNATFTSATITTTGFVAGSVEKASAKDAGSGRYDIELVVGGQTFKANVAAASTSYTLQSITDESNTITFGVTAPASATALNTDIQAALGLSSGHAISIASASADTTSTKLSLAAAGSATKAGDYGLSYEFDSIKNEGTYKLTDGKQVWESKVSSPSASLSAAKTITFENGMTATAAATFNERASVAVTRGHVSEGNQISMTFQTGKSSSDTLSLTFGGATASLLNLSGAGVDTMANAASASDKIENALKVINNMVAELGGKKSQLTFTNKNLSLLIQNQSAAKATFTDTDVTQSLQDSQQFKALVDMSSTVFQNALQQPGKLAQLVQSAMR